METIRPTADGLYVEIIPEPEQSPGGLWIPPEAGHPPQRALVLAVGPGRIDKRGNLIPMEVKVGDKVLFERFRGAGITPTVTGAPEYRLLHESTDVYGVCE